MGYRQGRRNRPTGALWIILISFVSMSHPAWAFGRKAPPPVEDSWNSHFPPPPPPVVSHGSTQLRILNYNIHGVPTAGDRARFGDIGRVLKQWKQQGSAPQIVAIQEAFVSDTNALVDNAGYRYVARGPGGSGLRVSSGLIILSDYPIIKTASTIYEFCTSWDCFANKGAVMARIQVPGSPTPLDIYATHMNSDPDTDFWTHIDEARNARFTQSQELREFIADQGVSNAPMVFLGDFNFNPGDFDYTSFLGFVGGVDMIERCSKNRSCSGMETAGRLWPSTLDYQFVIAGASPRINFDPIEFKEVFTEPYGGRLLSDHPGIEFRYQLSW